MSRCTSRIPDVESEAPDRSLLDVPERYVKVRSNMHALQSTFKGIKFWAPARFSSSIRGVILLLPATLLLPIICMAQGAAQHAAPRAADREQHVSRALEAARANPLELRRFLFHIPKGADLHNHLSGAVYAESWIRAAVEDHLCVDRASLAFAAPPAVSAQAMSSSLCAPGTIPAATALRDQHLYDALVDAFSMRDFVASAGSSGHDHFFDTFGRFGGTDPRHLGEWLDEVASRAAAQNEQYLELMHTPPFPHAAALAASLPWSDDFERMRAYLLAAGLREDIAVDEQNLDQGEARRRAIEHCGEPAPAPACSVQIRFLYQVLREAPKEQVFAQTVLGFELASADPRVVGINYVQPEDSYIAMNDYVLHMHIVGFLHSVYPRVHISLHAGELAFGLVPPAGLCCHIRLAVEVAHAERIGHGVDVMYEDRSHELLREMARQHVLVEINLTSNELILGVSGSHHPLPLYLQFGVPVALSTDDEGVSRIDLTHEYVRAVESYSLHYADLKRMVRASLEHSFLPGHSLWLRPDAFTQTVAYCSRDVRGSAAPSAACSAFLRSSDKAQQQWELERRFEAFESSWQ
jgi:adenosine deaminase